MPRPQAFPAFSVVPAVSNLVLSGETIEAFPSDHSPVFPFPLLQFFWLVKMLVLP
jgi:hypothetical protein